MDEYMPIEQSCLHHVFQNWNFIKIEKSLKAITQLTQFFVEVFALKINNYGHSALQLFSHSDQSLVKSGFYSSCWNW